MPVQPVAAEAPAPAPAEKPEPAEKTGSGGKTRACGGEACTGGETRTRCGEARTGVKPAPVAERPRSSPSPGLFNRLNRYARRENGRPSTVARGLPLAGLPHRDRSVLARVRRAAAKRPVSQPVAGQPARPP
jgi:hypothetical protein